MTMLLVSFLAACLVLCCSYAAYVPVTEYKLPVKIANADKTLIVTFAYDDSTSNKYSYAYQTCVNAMKIAVVDLQDCTERLAMHIAAAESNITQAVRMFPYGRGNLAAMSTFTSNATSSDAIGLVDTGATFTVVDFDTAVILNLQSHSTLICQTKITNGQRIFSYLSPVLLKIFSVDVNLMVLIAPKDSVVLIGMDVLKTLQVRNFDVVSGSAKTHLVANYTSIPHNPILLVDSLLYERNLTVGDLEDFRKLPPVAVAGPDLLKINSAWMLTQVLGAGFFLV